MFMLTEKGKAAIGELTSPQKVARIRALNDFFRTNLNLPHPRARFLMTRGVMARGSEFARTAVNRVITFKDFTDDNDPHGEHDFGSFEIDGTKLFWKVDYMDLEMKCGSEDPSDPSITTRVFTVLLASEW